MTLDKKSPGAGSGGRKDAARKRRYEPPKVTEEEVFERYALQACVGKNINCQLNHTASS